MLAVAHVRSLRWVWNRTNSLLDEEAGL
eukprot:SAG31_NODE_43199_length_268_cov_0.609467_1_plen_27_part_01